MFMCRIEENGGEFVCPFFFATGDAIAQNICIKETKRLIYTLYRYILQI